MRDPIVLQAEAERLDELLSLWHWLRSSSRIAEGYADRALVVGDFRISRQYDDQNSALDAALEEFQAAAVDFAARQMMEPWRTAIYIEARNLYTGHKVWRSPRLPENAAERVVIVRQAREQMTGRLKSAGVM